MDAYRRQKSGELVANFGIEFVVAIDKELVENRIFAALNLRYDPEWMHVFPSDVWLQQSTLGISAAVTAQVVEGVFFGIETHYVRGYDGIGANVFLGDAFVCRADNVLAALEEFCAIGGLEHSSRGQCGRCTELAQSARLRAPPSPAKI